MAGCFKFKTNFCDCVADSHCDNVQEPCTYGRRSHWEVWKVRHGLVGDMSFGRRKCSIPPGTAALRFQEYNQSMSNQLTGNRRVSYAAAAQLSTPSTPPSGYVCHTCEVPGHYRSDCPQRNSSASQHPRPNPDISWRVIC